MTPNEAIGDGMDWGAHRERWIKQGFDSVAVDALFGTEPNSESVASAEHRLQEVVELITLLDDAPSIMNEIPTVMQAHLLNHPEDVDEIRDKYMTHLRSIAPTLAAIVLENCLWRGELLNSRLDETPEYLGSRRRRRCNQSKTSIEEVAPRDSTVDTSRRSKQNREKERGSYRSVSILQQKGGPFDLVKDLI